MALTNGKLYKAMQTMTTVVDSEVVTILDAASSAELRGELAYTMHGLRSYIGAPVMVGGFTYGVLSYCNNRKMVRNRA